jgi:two-component system OmpR family sensor kinase
LRARLVGTVIVLLAVVCVMLGGLTEVALSKVLHDRIDAQLFAAAGRSFRANPGDFDEHGPPGPDHRPEVEMPQGQGAGTLAARLVGGMVETAEYLNARGEVRQVPAAAAAELIRLPVDGRPHTLHLKGLGDYRMLARETPNGDVLITGLPLAEVTTALVTIGVAEAIVIGLILLFAGLFGAVLIRRELRPLARVAATAGRVTRLRLDRGEVALAERVADTDPRTEVGQVGLAINRMLEHVAAALAARQASEMRVRQFVADASHELRTPLAAIRGYAELARRGGSSNDLAHALGRVESESERMTGLVEDLLLLARLDAGRPLAKEPVDLARTVVDAVSDAHAAGPRHRWQLDVPDESVMVTGDPDRLHQVVANLLSNASAHTSAGTAVRISLTVKSGEAVLTVADDGPGIPADLLPHVFERFARGDSSRSRAAGSTGLGLSIAYAVVTAHRGTITVASGDTGATFTVRLPMTPGGGAE